MPICSGITSFLLVIASALAIAIAAGSEDPLPSAPTRSMIGSVPVKTLSPACTAPPANSSGLFESVAPGLSWCQYNNPFILSDFLSRNSTDLTVRRDAGGEEQSFSFTKRCDISVPGSPHKQCEAIRQIHTASVGHLRDPGSMVRYVIYTDIDGHMLFVNFNNNTMADAVRIDVLNVTTFDVAMVRRIAEDDEPVQDAIFLVANTSHLAMQMIHGTDGHLSPTTCFLFVNMSSEQRASMTLEQAIFFPKENNFTNLVNLMWVWKQDILWTGNGSSIKTPTYRIFVAPTLQNTIGGFIENCQTQGLPMGVELGVQLPTKFEVKFDVIHNMASNMSFLIAYTNRTVNVFLINYAAYPPYGVIQANATIGYLYYLNIIPTLPNVCSDVPVFNITTNETTITPRWPSTVYCVPEGSDAEVTAVTTMSPDTWDNIGVFNRDVWLAIGIRNSSGAFLHVMDLQELTFANATQDGTLLNPLGLLDTFGTDQYPCDFDTQVYYPANGDRPATCEPRFVQVHALESDEPISQIVARVVEEGMNVNMAWPTTNATVLPGQPVNWTWWNESGTDPFALPTGNQTLPVPIVLSQHCIIYVAQRQSLAVFTFFTVAATGAGGDWNPTPMLQLNNNLNFLGDLRYVEVSTNGQHVFAAVRRDEWELDSQERYLDISNRVATAPDDHPLLAPYVAACASMPAQPVNLNAFTQYASSCTFNVYCPTLDRLFVTLADDRHYAERPAVQKLCPPGSFCPLGQRISCPPGFYCDLEGLTIPKPCPVTREHNITCADGGHVLPAPCPQGQVCQLTHMPGIGAPPGRATPTSDGVPRSAFVECNETEWCGLGRSAGEGAALMCPASTFCVNSSVVEPVVCGCVGYANISDGEGGEVPCDDRTMYCPAGTPNVSWCPAGSYCTEPNVIGECVPTQYCAEGTFAPGLCPGGKYCPTPAEALECPSGHFCPRGSAVPTPCNFLTLCPAGSESESRSFIAPFVLITVIVIVFVAMIVFKWYKGRNMRRSLEAVINEDDFLGGASPVSLHSQRGDTIAVPIQNNENVNGSGVARHSLYNTSVCDPVDMNSPRSDNDGGRQSNVNDPLLRGSSAVRRSIPTSRFATPTIRFEGMGLTLNVGAAKGLTVLDDVTGTIPPGSFVAVMGPSGSGKSTFMHTLAGKAFYGTRHGRVTINDDEVDLTQFANVVGFVKQDDIMIREMTVAETLLFNAEMRHDHDCGYRPDAIANSMLKALDLRHVRDTAIGDEKKRGISGGQRKRVNIGMEMVALPCVLFLDEPTSGLDSSSSMTVCAALRDMAIHGGVTVIAVIHQPRYEIFNMFHKVLLLAKGGRLVYYGPPDRALEYFEQHLGLQCPPHVNPPDFFMDVISGEDSALPIEEMVRRWKAAGWEQPPAAAGDAESAASPRDESAAAIKSHEPADALPGAELAALSSAMRKPGYYAQTRHFTMRALTQLSRDLVWFFTDLLLVLIAGLFLGLVFSKSKYLPPLPYAIVNKSLSAFHGSPPPSLSEFFDRPIDDPIISEASLTCMAIGMTGITAALRVFGNEQIVYWREASAGMSTTSYFVAKNIVHAIFIIISPMLYLAPFLTFVSARASILSYYRVLVVVQFTTTGLGYLVTMVTPSGLAQLAGVVVVLVMAMFGGAQPTLVQINEMFPLLRIVPYMSYIRWGQEALYIQEIREWSHVEGVKIGPSLRLFDYHLDNYDLCLFITAAYGVGFRLLALLAMKLMHREQKH
jgi:ABC-type multidrug transport system ATPase subunit